MTSRVCVCGRQAHPDEVECSLCGRDLGGPRSPDALVPGPVAAPRDSRPGAAPTRRGPLALVAVLAVLVVVLLAVVLERPDETAPPAATSGEQAQDPGAGVGSASPSPADADASSEPSPEPSPMEEPSPSEEPSVTDAPAPVDAESDQPEVVEDSDGKECDTAASETAYGGYPLARCDLWKATTGLLTGEPAARGPKSVACQRDLGQDNPVYAKNQSNTWWVWARSSAGTWDWFPETAVRQGASDQPINGIALCRS